MTRERDHPAKTINLELDPATRLEKQVFERLTASYDKQPYTIRRMLTEGTVRAADKRDALAGETGDDVLHRALDEAHAIAAE